ncbi:MAG: DUF4900 domain-containing protein [Candidatus Omnitrophica bacterium]|nr:DUF4900 domain-containing protein [Candidatus Omnitrophota bacterium]
MKMNNEKGVALIVSLFVVVVLLGMSAVFILRSVYESRIVQKELDMAKSFYIAEAGSKAALDGLDTIINTHMLNTVNATNPSTLVSQTRSYVTAHDGITFLINYAKNSGVPVLTLTGTDANYIQSAALGGGNYQYDIRISEKTDPVTVTADSWDFPFNYRIVASGAANGLDKDVVLSGDFTVRVQRDNFAKYALFTNQQTLPDGTTNVWFTDKTNFAGPLHTNGRYNIAMNPSGIFDGVVAQVDPMARFYNGGSPILLNDYHNGTIDVPTFNSGFTRNASAISLSSASVQANYVDQVRGTATISSNGVYVPNNGTSLTGGIYVQGNGNVTLSVDGSGNQVYNVVQGGTQKIITVNRSTHQTTVNHVGVSTVTYGGAPDGVDGVGTAIYVHGNISSLSGTVQQDTPVTISSNNDMIITNNLKYQSYTPATGTPGTTGYIPPSVPATSENLLGLVTWNGNVRIGTAAPNNVEVHGTILAKSGILAVDDYTNTSVGSRGVATLLGGVIQNFYGAFGQFNGGTGTQISGYGRNFVYDDRMAVGNAPPYFPSLNTFIAFTNDITDKMIWQEGT